MRLAVRHPCNPDSTDHQGTSYVVDFNTWKGEEVSEGDKREEMGESTEDEEENIKMENMADDLCVGIRCLERGDDNAVRKR